MPPALILTLDAALDGCSAGLVSDGVTVALQVRPGGRGSAAVLPELARLVMAEMGVTPPDLSLIAVTVGPGSFTGIRAALSLAQGLGLAAGVPVHGVSIPDAMRAELGHTPEQSLWIVIDSTRGRVFLDRDRGIVSLPVAEIPVPRHPVLVAGDAAAPVVAHLRALGGMATPLDPDRPGPSGIAAGAVRHGCEPVPLYIDPVEARPGPVPRPAPV